MRVVNYTDFRNNLAENLNEVNDDGDILVVTRTKGKTVVVLSLDEFNSIQETLHLISSKSNQKRLDLAIKEMNAGKSSKHRLKNK
jgi:antitoxin YefM